MNLSGQHWEQIFVYFDAVISNRTTTRSPYLSGAQCAAPRPVAAGENFNSNKQHSSLLADDLVLDTLIISPTEGDNV